MTYVRKRGHKLAIGLGVLMLVPLWYGLFGMEDEPMYKLEQAAGLLGGLVAFGVALALSRGQRENFRVGWAYLGAIVATVILHASLLAAFGSGPTSRTVAISLGSGVGYGLPYLLLGYGWRGGPPVDEVAEG